METIKVSSKSNPSSVAGALANALREKDTLEIQAIGAGALNQIAKLIFQRTRPTIEHLVLQDGYSFPSGHSMASLICYGGIVFLIFHLTQKNWIRWTACLFAILLIIMVGISRIYLGVHFPSDVLGGFCLAGSWLSLTTAFYSMKLKKK